MNSKFVLQRSLQMVVHTWRNDTLFINIINSSSHNGTFPLPNPFDVRRLMSNSKPAVEVTSEDGEPAPYYPVPINHPASSECCTHLPISNKPKSKSILRMSFKKSKNKGILSVMNAFVTILVCVCLLGAVYHTLVGFYIRRDAST